MDGAWRWSQVRTRTPFRRARLRWYRDLAVPAPGRTPLSDSPGGFPRSAPANAAGDDRASRCCVVELMATAVRLLPRVDETAESGLRIVRAANRHTALTSGARRPVCGAHDDRHRHGHERPRRHLVGRAGRRARPRDRAAPRAATRDVWSRCTRVVVDLSAATFIECTVVNWLLRARRTVESSGAKVAVIVEAPSGGCASRVFDVIGLRDILTCYPERETLLAQRVSSAIAGRATARALPRLDEGGPGVDDRRQHGEPRRRLQ